MNRGKLTNRELDELGKRLVLAAKTGDGEIERLVSNPRLYDGVLAKIAIADEPAREPQRHLAWKPVGVMAISVMIFSVALFGYLRLAGGEQIVRERRVTPVVYVVNHDEKPFQRDTERPEPPVNNQPKPVRAVVTKPTERTSVLKSRKARTAPVQHHEPAFYPIGFSEKAEDAAIDGRVVRVEMPRSALYALGMDLPLENGTRAVRADLLVGADGIPRGIRLVE